ncbi:MAG TPA: hypothetical protein VMX17_09435 [Candidatus Glassbacteria bacterium]|nr:hypothetical protein [Candidatus Glassbacteria bacterium]
MALSSDEIIKREILDFVGVKRGALTTRVFPEGSTEDQKTFVNGGLTFSYDNLDYGSCDLAWYYTDDTGNKVPVIAVEGTDALNRGSSGNAQCQRFHHALGAVKKGLIGIYYLRPGIYNVFPDLYGMAYYATKYEKGYYLIIQDLGVLQAILDLYNKDSTKLKNYLNDFIKQSLAIYKDSFESRYNNDWSEFAKRRSTIIKEGYIIKHAGRMRRNFTDASQRGGHIALGEMYLTKYLFYDKFFYYLWPRMFQEDLDYLDSHKLRDKEWKLLRKEPNVKILTLDDISNIPRSVDRALRELTNIPLKGNALRKYTAQVKIIVDGLINDSMSIKKVSRIKKENKDE